MSNNQIKKVVLALETAGGESHLLAIEDPGPTGANAAFMSQQLEAALADFAERGHALINAVYGHQIRIG